MPDTAKKEIEKIDANGAPVYDSTVEPARKTKEDVEARLKSTSDSISMRLEAIQKEIGSTGDSIRRFVNDHPLAAVFASLAAGLVVGRAAGGRKDKSTDLSDAIVTGLTSAIEEALEEGAEPVEAVRSAIEDIEPYLAPPSDSSGGGVFSTLLRIAIRSGLAVLIKQGFSSISGSEPDTTDIS